MSQVVLAVCALLAAVTLAAALAAGAGRLSDWLGPRLSVPTLAGTALAIALGGGAALTVLAVALLARAAPVAALGGWSARVVGGLFPVPVWAGVLAGIALSVLLGRALIRAGSVLWTLIGADRTARRLRGAGGPLIISDQVGADAFTLAGIRGCVVIGRPLWDGLTAAERTMVVAHELSHLGHRHHLYLQVTTLAAAANPLLRPVERAVRLGVERWADEDGVLALSGDRRQAARALAGAALLRSGLRRSDGGAPTLGVADHQVATRAAALLAPATPTRGHRVLGPAGLGLAVLVLGGAAGILLHHDLELAHRFLLGR